MAKFTNPDSYCSGVLLNADTILTCAHFFRAATGSSRVHVAGVTRNVVDLVVTPGTDVAVAKIDPVKIPEGVSLPRLGSPPRRFERTATFGYGGRISHPAARTGFFLGALPISTSLNFRTIVRPAGIVYNTTKAVKGDSGGPVVAGGYIFGVQSLILDPAGINLHFATVSLITGRVALGVDPLPPSLRKHARR